MSTRDFAIVIGINEYAELDPLGGARNDAEDFLRWLSQSHSQAQVGVNDLFVRVESPSYSELRKAVAAVWKKAKVVGGRRLYIFYSGHGFGTKLTNAGVYTSDYIEDFDGGRCDLIATAELLRVSGHFREVVVFMDCCRVFDNRHTASIIAPNLGQSADREPAQHFYCLACGLGDTTRELSFGSKIRGEFSVHLMKGLDGHDEAVDADGNVTAHSLRRYLSRLPKTHWDPLDSPDLKNLVLAKGFPQNSTSFEVNLSEPEKSFGLYRGNPFSPLSWKIDRSEGRILVRWEERDVAVIITVPAREPFERREAIFPGETSVTI